MPPAPAPADVPAPDPLRAAWHACGLVTWHDVDVAFEVADLSGAVDSKGTVYPELVRREVRRLAQSKRWLVRQTPAYGTPLTGQPSGPSGAAVGSGRARTLTTQAQTDAALIAKYPALQR